MKGRDLLPISEMEDREEKADYFTVGGPQFGDTGKRARAWEAQATTTTTKLLLGDCPF